MVLLSFLAFISRLEPIAIPGGSPIAIPIPIFPSRVRPSIRPNESPRNTQSQILSPGYKFMLFS